jgi:putative ABC transport system permease protein
LFVVFVVLTLALGIGANTTVFTVINTLILNPLPLPNPSELAAVIISQEKSTSASNMTLPMSYANFKDYEAQNEIFASFAGYTSPRIVTLDAGSGSQRLFSELVTGDYFTTLGIKPAMGRFFSPEEHSTAGRHAVAVMNYATRAKGVFQTIGRLRPGISRTQAQANISTITSALAREYPHSNEGRTATVRSIAEVISGGNNSAGILFGSAILLVVVGIVLLIACSNVANLLLARSAARQQEIAVRLALGASRGRLVRQLLTESVFLGLLSGLVGLGIGYAGVQLLWSFRPPEVSANFITPKLDVTVFLFSLGLSLLTGFIFGTIPALRASRTSTAETLKEEARTTGRSRRKITFANALLVGQVALSFVALVTAALFLRSIERSYRIDPGLQTSHLAVFMTNPGQAGYGNPQSMAFYKDVRVRVAGLPGVESASWSANLPLWGRIANGLEVEGRQQRSKADTITTVVNTIDLHYFQTADIAIKRGRDFSQMDQEGSLPVAIVNEKLAQDYWPNEEALGKHVQLPGEKVRRQVVSVAKTANYYTLGEPPQSCVYVPLQQSFSDAMVLYVRSKGDPQQVLLAVQREMHAIGPQISVSDIRTGSKIVDQALFGARMGVGLLSAFGLLALGLASIGLYGIIAYSVNLRTREIGVRMALGAAPNSVLVLIFREGMSLVMIGVMIGLAATLIVTRLLARMLYGVSSSDPISVAGAATVLLVIAFLACYLPARSASRLDPLTALHKG